MATEPHNTEGASWRIVNDQTGETGILRPEPEDSWFEFMLYVDRAEGEPHELGYWNPREWEREGWRQA